MGSRRLAVSVAVWFALLAPARAAEPYATTSVAEVGAAALTGGPGAGLLAFTARQDVLRDVAAARLGGARIDRTHAFAGLWAYGGDVGAWFEAPSAADGLVPQLEPRTGLVENGSFESALTADGAALSAGDRVEYGMALIGADAPLAWERERAAATGTLQWRQAVATREVTSTFGSTRGTLDAVMFRADIVAAGGDVDARHRPLELPPLVIDLPRNYQPGARYVGVTGVASPYNAYVSDFRLVPAPEAGKAILSASVRGYLPEGRARTLANGAAIREWHLPLTGVLAIDRGASLLGPAPRSRLSLPAGGVAQVVTASGTRLERLEPGAVLTAGTSGIARDAGAPPAPGAAAPPAVAGTALDAAASVDRSTTVARRIDLGSGGLAVTVDPDFRGEGVLALRDARNLRIGKAFARVVAVPAIRRGDDVVRLDRSRLTDLRVVPFRENGGVRFTPTASFADGGPNQATTTNMRFPGEGILVSAAYDAGDGEVARVEYQLFHDGVPRGGRVNVNVEIESLTRPDVAAYPLVYAETPQRGPVMHREARWPVEASGLGSRPVTVGTSFADAVFRSDTTLFGGTVTALAAPAPTLGRAPDGSVPIEGRPLVLTYAPPVPAPSAGATLSTFRFGLADDPRPAVAARPQIGGPCAAPQITGGLGDISDVWFDADPRSLYASLRLRAVPTPATAPAGARYGVAWWHDSVRYEVRATMTAAGAWSYAMHIGNLRIPLAGEISGNVIRIEAALESYDWIPGDRLRDVGAYAYVGTTETRRERVPAGSSDAYGLGGEYRITPCPGTAPVILGTQLELSPASAVFGAPAQVRGRLLDAAGAPLSGEAVELAVTGDGGERVLDAVTGPDGSVTFDAGSSLVPGRYALQATYEGRRDALGPAVAAGALEVRRAPAVLDLRVSGTGAAKTLHVALARAGGAPLGGREIALSSRGKEFARVTTAGDGTATVSPPPDLRGAKTPFEAVFDGDAHHERAHDAT